MSFPKAAIKRFNEEVNDAPAPNAYDAKMPKKKVSSVSLSKDNLKRFLDPAMAGPGPGTYMPRTALGGGTKGAGLLRSASFRDRSRSSRTDVTDCSVRSDVSVFKTPCSTPLSKKKGRRSVSQGDLTADLSPIKDLAKDLAKERQAEEEEEAVGRQLEAAMGRLRLEEEGARLRARVEELEAEVATARAELALKGCEVEELGRAGEEAADRLEAIRGESSAAASLRGEVLLLQQDNRSLEDHLEASRTIRGELEGRLEQSRAVREELQSRVTEEDAKAVFLHFTQEQLNSQVNSLEDIVKNLKVENHLLNGAVQKLINCVNEEKVKVTEEKEKLEEVTAQYNAENADAEIEFSELQTEVAQLREELAGLRAEAKGREVELRAQLGQAEVKKLELQQINERLEAVNDELRNDVEVAENDRTVLKDSLVEVETERTKMNLDLGEVSQQKLALEAVAAQAQEEADRLRGELGEARDGRTEAEMETAALQGELSSLREELAAAEEAAAALRGEVGSATQAHAGLLAQYGEAEAVAEQQRAVVASLEELQVLEAAARRKLEEEAVQREEAAARLEAQLAAAGEELTLAGERQQELEEAAETGRQEAREATIRREEVEESLLDTQGLVEAMEDRLQEADTCNRQEVDEVAGRARRAEAARDRVAGERAALLEMNTALSAQVTDSLNCIHELQQREVELTREVALLRGFMEAAQEEGEAERIRIMQAEDEILSLQAEVETVLMEREEAGRAAGHWAEAAHQAQQQAQDFDAARGDLGAQLDNLKSAYNAAVAELGESKGVGRELLARVSGLEHEVEKKRAENDRLLKDFQDRNQEALDDMLRARQTFEGETKLLRENVTHLEILRNNLERSVSEKEETARTRQEEAAVAREAVVAAEARQADAEKANLRLKANLELRAAEARSLKEEARGVRDRCGEEVRRREGSLERVKADCRELQENVAQVEALRRRELEMVVELRGQLAVTTDAEEQAESAVRSMEAQQRLLQEAEARVDEFKTALEQWQQKFGEAEDVMQAMEGEKEQLEAERGRLEKQLAELQQMVEPYRDQLEAFELERRALVAQSQVAEGEAQKLAVQNGRLLGHQNHSQKIQHVVKLKQENVGLKTELAKTSEELQKTRRQLVKAEERLGEAQGVKRFDSRMSFQPKPDKENSMVTPARGKAPLPAPASARPSRHSTGSPLRVNRN